MLEMENTGKSAALFLLFDDTEEGALQFILEKQCFRHTFINKCIRSVSFGLVYCRHQYCGALCL